MANFQRVTPGERAQLAGILKWAREQPHPFTACMNSKGLTAKVPDPERRKKICAVMVDTAKGTTKWRNN